jgi:hypothetical protein
VYESLQNEESLAKAFRLALQNGCDKEKLHRLAEKYGQSAAWNLKWDPKDPGSKPVTNWQLNAAGDQRLKCELEFYDCLEQGDGR